MVKQIYFIYFLLCINYNINVINRKVCDLHTLEPIKIQLENFEGPYDLLLTLLEKNKLEITEISINEIADQYIDCITSSGGFDLDIASEFLLMCVTLIHMKSKKLLPKTEEEEEEITAEELAKRLALYKEIKNASFILEEKLEYWNQCFYKEPEKLKFPLREEILELNLFELSNCRTIVEQRFIAARNDNSAKMEMILETEKVSLKDKMKQVILAITSNTKARFSELFNIKKQSKTEIVTGFMAVLELNRRKKVKLTQDTLFGEINILKSDDVDYFDLDDFYKNYEDGIV